MTCSQKENEDLEKKSRGYEDELNAIKKTIIIKLKAFDVMNKQLAQLIESAGGKEEDPTEIKVSLSAVEFA